MLQVRFAEVNRSVVSQLGANIFHNFGSKMPFLTTTQQFAGPQLGNQQSGANNFTISDLLNVFIFRPDIDLAATIKALQQQNVLEILAEPNLMTASGKDASFLAGGEFPFPILQSSSGGGFAGITIQFKEFGVRLNFTPSLTTDGQIHLKVRPEVSSLDFTNALTIQGFFIPALSTRRVESEMDLSDGQSFAIAGLVDNRVTEQLSKIPGIGDIPVLGKLFRSRSLNKTRNELLIVVTPRVVQPVAADKAPHGPEFPAPFLEPAAPARPKPSTPSHQLLLEAMRSGVQDFLPKPVNPDALKEILSRFMQESETKDRSTLEKLIIVMGSKGGVGTTTVAVNLGVQLSTYTHKRVVLLDFARPLGNVHLLLDLHTKFGVRDAVENLDRLDGHFFSGLLTHHKTKLEILGGAMQPEEWQSIAVPPLERVVNVAQSSFDMVLIDIGSQF